MADDQEEWIPIRHAVAEVSEVYLEALKGTYQEARFEAIRAINRWLSEAACSSRSPRWGVNFSWDGRYRRGLRSDSHGEAIPGGLWRYVQGLKPNYVDWVSGEFLCEGLMHEGSRIEVTIWAYDVVIDRRGLPIVGQASTNSSGIPSRKRGRPRQWNWDGAMCAIIAQANTLNGLPDGHGAQAEIGRMMAKWFQDNQNGEPALSEIGLRAAQIMAALDAHRK